MSVTSDTGPASNATRPAGGRWARFWRAPDPILLEAGAAGELFTARLRVALTATLLMIPLYSLAAGSGPTGANLTSLTAASIATGAALVVLVLVRGGRYTPLLGILSGVLDVTLISTVLLVFMLLGRPDIAANSYVVYPVYLLALGATVLRYDARTCVVAGALALAQYALIVALAATHWDLNGPAFAAREYGRFDWSTQVSRLVLLAATAVLATSAVLRTQHWLRLSASDALTGLMNRGFFDQRVEEEFLRARRYRRPLAVAMIDIDHFKLFNDTYGHAAGDDVLRLVAQKISEGLRRTDVVARYGGEELAVILPETDRESAAQKAELLRRAVEAARIAVRKAHGPVGVTISVGVASFPADGEVVTDVLEKADARLYSAKQKGRNRVSGAVDRRSA